jgi:hypothetical protein
MFDLLPCHEIPFLMISVAILGAAFLIFGWATNDPEPLPAWRWGDKARREPKVPPALIDHVAGAFFAGLAATYAINNPLCG